MILQGITKALAQVNKLTEIYAPATLVVNAQSYDVSTGNNTLVATESAIQGIIDSFDFKEIDNDKVLQNDIKFIVMSTSSLTFNSATDQVILRNIKYNIVHVKAISIGSSDIMYTLQLRA